MKHQEYSPVSIGIEDLVLLRDFALNLLRTYPYCTRFSDLLLAITLCQGAANHYAVCNALARRYFDPRKNGVKDFGVWFFFRKEDGRTFNPRWLQPRDLGKTKFGSNPNEPRYQGRRVDFLGCSIDGNPNAIEASIVRWLRKGSRSPGELSKKAVIGLYPNTVLGRVIWVNPDLI